MDTRPGLQRSRALNQGFLHSIQCDANRREFIACSDWGSLDHQSETCTVAGASACGDHRNRVATYRRVLDRLCGRAARSAAPNEKDRKRYEAHQHQQIQARTPLRSIARAAALQPKQQSPADWCIQIVARVARLQLLSRSAVSIFSALPESEWIRG